MRRFAAVAALLFAVSAGAADWSQWSSWQSSDPEVRASSAFSAKAGNATQRTAYASPYSGGGATLNAVRGFNGVWEASKSHPITKAQVASMARGVARGLGWAGLAAAGAQSVIDALNSGGVTWDEQQNDWVVPQPFGEFYYSDYENDFDFSPSDWEYRIEGYLTCTDTSYKAIVTLADARSYADCMVSDSYEIGGCSVIGWFSSAPHWRYASCTRTRLSDGQVTEYGVQLSARRRGCPAGEVALPGGGCGSSPDPVPVPPAPASDAEMEEAISDGIDEYPGSAPAIAQESAEAGAPIPITETPAWTGPSSVPGGTSSSTSTGPGGTTTEQSATTHHFSYGDPHPDAITVTDEETTTTTAPDGQQTTTTTTTTGEQVTGGDAGGTGTGGQTQIFDPCKFNADMSACVPLGLVEDLSMETHEAEVDFSVDETSGSCPAPIALPVMGQVHELSWQPVCDFATGTAPIVRAMAALSAGLWVIFMFRRS